MGQRELIKDIEEGRMTIRVVVQGLASFTPNDFIEVDQANVTSVVKTMMPFFSYYDANKDKVLDVSEFKTMLNDLTAGSMSEIRQERLFAAADADENGVITFDEFIA